MLPIWIFSINIAVSPDKSTILKFERHNGPNLLSPRYSQHIWFFFACYLIISCGFVHHRIFERGGLSRTWFIVNFLVNFFSIVKVESVISACVIANSSFDTSKSPFVLSFDVMI